MESWVAESSKTSIEIFQEIIEKPDTDDDKKEAKEFQKLLKKIARRIIPYWDVEVVRGEHRGKAQKMFGVRVTSKLYGGESRTFTLDFLYDKSTAAKTILKDIGPFRPDDYGILVEYVRLLIDEGKVIEVDALSDQLDNCLSFDRAKSDFDFMKTKILEQLDFFPRLSSRPYGVTYGMRLDNGNYIQRFGLVINEDHPELEDIAAFAITVDFLTKIFGISSCKTTRFKALIRSWYGYGFLAPVEHYDDTHSGEPVYTGSAEATKHYYLFRICNFVEETEKVKESMRYCKHVE